MPRGYWPGRPIAPHGTTAAARRHWRHGEKPCEACAWAERDAAARRGGYRMGSTHVPDRREIRNGLPEFRPYRYQGTGRDAYDGSDLFDAATVDGPFCAPPEWHRELDDAPMPAGGAS